MILFKPCSLRYAKLCELPVPVDRFLNIRQRIKVTEMRIPSRFKRRVLKGHCRRGCCFSPSDRSASPKPEGVRRRLTGAPAAVWRSRADDPAGTDGEPKGAMVLPFLPLRTYSRRKSTEKTAVRTPGRRGAGQTRMLRAGKTTRAERRGAARQRGPDRSPRRGVMFFAAQKAGLSPALLTAMRPPLIPAKISAWQLYGAVPPGASQSC